MYYSLIGSHTCTFNWYKNRWSISKSTYQTHWTRPMLSLMEMQSKESRFWQYMIYGSKW